MMDTTEFGGLRISGGFCTALHAQGIPLWEFSLTICMKKEKGATNEVFTS